MAWGDETGERVFRDGRLHKVWGILVKYETHRRVDISGDETIRSLIITEGARDGKRFKGRVDCEDHSPEAGPYELGWEAVEDEEGLAVILNDGPDANGGTYSPEFNSTLMRYIAREVRTFQGFNPAGIELLTEEGVFV